MAPVTYQLFRDSFVLELSLDDQNGRFTVNCQPPAALDQEDVQRQTRKWVAHVARGYNQRHRNGFSAAVQFLPCREPGILRGQILTSQ